MWAESCKMYIRKNIMAVALKLRELGVVVWRSKDRYDLKGWCLKLIGVSQNITRIQTHTHTNWILKLTNLSYK